jgi:hypothetical protein
MSHGTISHGLCLREHYIYIIKQEKHRSTSTMAAITTIRTFRFAACFEKHGYITETNQENASLLLSSPLDSRCFFFLFLEGDSQFFTVVFLRTVAHNPYFFLSLEGGSHTQIDDLILPIMNDLTLRPPPG